MKLQFLTPVRIKKNSSFSNNVDFVDIINSIYRRLSVLNALEGYEISRIDLRAECEKVEVKYIQIYKKNISRISNRQKNKMSFKGTMGSFEINNLPENLKKILVAGELIHVGKNTSFGLGQYILSRKGE